MGLTTAKVVSTRLVGRWRLRAWVHGIPSTREPAWWVQQLEGADHTLDRLHLDAEGFDPVMRVQAWPCMHGGRGGPGRAATRRA